MHTYALTHTRCTRPFPSAPVLGHRWALVPCLFATARLAEAHPIRRSAQPSRCVCTDRCRRRFPVSSTKPMRRTPTAQPAACCAQAARARIARAGERRPCSPQAQCAEGRSLYHACAARRGLGEFQGLWWWACRAASQCHGSRRWTRPCRSAPCVPASPGGPLRAEAPLVAAPSFQWYPSTR